MSPSIDRALGPCSRSLVALYWSLVALVRVPSWEWLSRVRALVPQVARHDTAPTAWDKVFQTTGPCFVRVLNGEGRWIGGYYGPHSYASSYPEPQQLYLERVFDMADDGAFGEELPGTSGVLVDCAGIQLLHLIIRRAVEEDT